MLMAKIFRQNLYVHIQANYIQFILKLDSYAILCSTITSVNIYRASGLLCRS